MKSPIKVVGSTASLNTEDSGNVDVASGLLIQLGSTAGLVLLLVSLAMMVAAGF
ncbi:MAG: hypothetical protein KGI38_00885 [Thaumarchaeota archaeon]|nr:hypothetical protein [Nitrososphaerota archaeon]